MAYNLKDPEEVKEYLQNLHTEYQFGCYKEKNPEVCHLLGDYAEAVEQDYKKGCEIYKMNCDNYDYGRSCTKFGACNLVEEQYKRDNGVAYTYSKKACELGEEKGCLQAGVMALTLEEDLGEPDKQTKMAGGLSMLRKACHEKGLEMACFYLSGVYMHGREGYIERSYKEAYKASLKSCELGNPFACANVAQMHARGDGVQRNMELAETFRKRAEVLHKELANVKPQLNFHIGT